jgi:hypothetical protein
MLDSLDDVTIKGIRAGKIIDQQDYDGVNSIMTMCRLVTRNDLAEANWKSTIAASAKQAVQILAKQRGGKVVKNSGSLAEWYGHFDDGALVEVCIEEDYDGLDLIIKCTGPHQQITMLQVDMVTGEELANKLNALIDIAESFFPIILRALKVLGPKWQLINEGTGVSYDHEDDPVQIFLSTSLTHKFEFTYSVAWRDRGPVYDQGVTEFSVRRFEHDEANQAIALAKELMTTLFQPQIQEARDY